MPIITVQFIKDVVATPDQKRELIEKLTETFVGVLGEVVRPYVYCLIQETPQMEWGIAGRPMPDLAFLTGPEYTGYHHRANELMGAVLNQPTNGQQANGQQANGNAGRAAPSSDAISRADRIWRGADRPSAEAAMPATASRSSR